MATNQSSWKVGQWTTPTTTVTTQPVPSEVTAESRSQISHNIPGQFASFIQDEYPTFIEFVKAYYKSQELRGYCFDVINNWGDYYNIDNYGSLVVETDLISSMSTTSTTVDVTTTRDFPDEGLLMIDDEIIYYKNKGQTIFNECSRGFDAVKSVGTASQYVFSETTAAEHALGAKVINLNNIFPLFMLGQFKDQYLSTYPKNFADGVIESNVIKRIKDFYASKGTTRSFQFVLRTLFGVESEVSYPRDRIFKPSDAYFTNREVIRATAVSGDPTELVGEVLYQENDPSDPYVNEARIYVKGVQKVFTASGEIYEIDVDTNNSSGTFVTPYKTTVASDVPSRLDFTTITVDSTLGWPELNGRFRVQDEIISYTSKTVNQFIGCVRAREGTTSDEHIAGQEAFAAFRIYGKSNRDGSDIQIKVFGGTRGVNLTNGGKYYLPKSKVTTPGAPGFDSLDAIWSSFQYNVRKALRGVTAELASPAADGSVRVTVTTREKHRLRRDDKVRILNAAEDIYNNEHDVVGIIDEFKFEFILGSAPTQPILATDDLFFISREFAFGTSVYTSINNLISQYTADVQNVYKSSDHAIVASTGIPSHKIGPFAVGDADPGNQRYLKRIPLVPSTKSTKTPTPIGQVGIGVNGVPFFSYKGDSTKKFGGIASITKINGGDGYDIENPPTVEFEPDYKLNTSYATGIVVKHDDSGTVRRYRAQNPGTSSKTTYPTHTTGAVTHGTVDWEFLGLGAAAEAIIDGRIIAINVNNGGGGYTTQPIISITGGGAPNSTQATAVAQITDGRVTGIAVTYSGAGYTKAAGLPNISISGGGGVGAVASAVVRGPINAISITDAGSQYTYEPLIALKSGSGAVGYASILNGKIESIIVTFGGADYFGAPDVVITGDGVGATAFAVVDPTSRQVTSVTVTNKGLGYTTGNTQISIVYPGDGANFTTNLTELTYNEAATADEIKKNDPSAVFSDRKVVDDANGTIVRGENIGIYAGEYGYFYTPDNLRYYLGDSIESRIPTVSDPSPWIEQNPTGHSPIIGWAYDGHPIYGPYGFEDRQNQNPYNSYIQPASSYRIKASRASILSGLTDPMGTFIEDYEYVEGLGDLDRYNGRYCVTPEYPEGVYAYFTTIDGVSGAPKFPYFIGPDFYSEADEINWNGNGLQRNFTEDAIRFRAPYIGTDQVTAKRKALDSRIDFVLAMEDSTTLITLESGEILQYIEDGIGYFSYYPTIRGGSAQSLTVAATNRYSSTNINDFLVEGGGQGYKVNDRLLFDNTDTGGAGVSATISTVTGEPVSTLNYVVNDEDVTIATLTTTNNHYLVGGDQITVSIGDNAYEREIKSYLYNSKFYFKYFDLVSYDFITEWTNSTAYTKFDLVFVANRVYQATETATSDSDANNAPTHVSGTVSDGTMSWKYIRKRTDGAVIATTTNSLGSGYLPGVYTDVPMVTNGNGKDLIFDLTVAANGTISVSSVPTTADRGTAFKIGDTITVNDDNVGSGGGSGFQLTVSQITLEAVVRTDAAHQVGVGDIVDFKGMNAAGYNGDFTVVRTDTLRRFTIAVNQLATNAAPNITNSVVSVREPKFQYINGHSYKFDTSDSTLDNVTLAFTLDPLNTDIFTYKNIIDEVVDSQTNQQTSVTLKIVDLPGIFYYFDLAGQYSITGSYFTIINEPLAGTNILLSKTDTTASYATALEPEVGYDASHTITYSTNSIYPTGGVSTISIGDSGRNYESLPQLSGSTRAGAGATAVATISGVLSGVSVTNKGSGYDPNALPTGVVTLPDFVDLTLTNVLGSGSFAVNEIIISQSAQGTQTARGKVLNWNPLTSILRIQPLQNGRTGAANKGYIMFTTFAANNDRGNVFSSDSQATVSAVSGAQATVLCSIPSSGPDVGKLSEVTVTGPGSNYRAAPNIILDPPDFGLVNTVTITTNTTGLTPGQYTGVTQSAVNPSGGTNVQFTVTSGAGGTVEQVVVTDGGGTYRLGDIITIPGDQIGGATTANDITVTVTVLTHVDPASTLCSLNATVDSITITNTGSGYLSAPDVLVSGGSGINAKFNASIQNQGISAINIEAGGELFQNAPVVNITQKTGTGASILLKSTDLGKILKIGGDNITFNYSHDRTLKPELNTTYNLQLTRTQVIDYLEVTDGGANFVAIPEIVLTGGSGSLFDLKAVIENEVIQSVEVRNPGRGFLSAPSVNAKITHNWVGLRSNSTLNFPYNAKIPTGTKVTLNENIGTFPTPLATNTTYYAIAATLANGLANNQIRLATTQANAIAGTSITFTSDPIGDTNGLTEFTLSSIDLGDIITAYMKPANFLVGERVYQGTSTTTYTAFGIIKDWDSRGRILSVEIIEGDFLAGEPVFGEESAAFGEIHAFDRADATFNVSPISTSAEGWERTTGFLDVNEQRIYDSDRFQEYSYQIASPININKWKNPLKFAAHPAGFKVLGTQVVLESSAKVYRSKSTINSNYSSNEPWAWWVESPQPGLQTFNGTTYVFPKPSARSTGKLATIKNFALGDPDYSASVPTEVQIFGRQLLDIQKILSCISYKIDDISSSFNGSTTAFNLTISGATVTTKIGKTSIKEQFLVTINGIVQNPNNYTFVNDVITFSVAPKTNSIALIMYYDRASYTSSFQLDQIGDEIKAFDTTNGLTGGTGYADGTYTAIPLRNKIGSGVGATADITVSNGYVSNVVLNNSGDGFRDDGIVGISEIGKPLTNSYSPSTATYAPSTGVLELTVGSHTLSAPTTATATDIDYNPNTGIMTVTLVSHGLKAGDQVKFADNSITLSCAFGGASGAAAQKTYPRSTDYASDRWLEVSNIKVNTFDVQVLDTIPSTNVDPHSFVSAVAGGISIAQSTVRFSNNAITFSCGFGGGGNRSYPRSTDPIAGKNVPVDAITSTTFTVNALNGTTPTNTDAHTYIGNATTALSPTFVDYDASLGIMKLELANHGLSNGNFIQFTSDSLNFICSRDNYATTTAYPRGSDPAAVNWLNVFDVETNSFKVQVGANVEKAFTPTGATYTASTGSLTLDIENHGFTAATEHTATNAAFNTTTGIVTITSASHGFAAGDRVKIKDSSITMSCGYNGGGQESYPKPGQPISGKWITVRAVTQDTFDIQCLKDAPCSNSDAHTFVSASANGILHAKSVISIDDEALTFTCTQDDDFSRKSYPRTTDPASRELLGIEAVTTDTLTVNVGTSPQVTFTPTNAVYTPSTGVLVLTIGNHTLPVGTGITIDVNSLKFRCDMENDGTLIAGNLSNIGASLHNYPRPTDPAAKSNLYITETTGTTITVNVKPSVTVNYQPTNAALNLANGDLSLTIGAHQFRGEKTFTPTDVAYTPSTGIATLTIKGHTIQAGDFVQVAKESLTFTCAQDSHQTNHSYPRTTDPVYREWIQVLSVTNDTITLNFYSTVAGNSDHIFVSAVDNCIALKGDTIKLTDGSIVMSCDNGGVSNQSYPRTDTISYSPTGADYDPSTGVMTVTHGGGAGAFVNGDQVKFDDNAIVFTCAAGGGTHAYPRPGDPASGRWLTIWDADDTTFKVQVLDTIPSTNTSVHVFSSAVANGTKKKKDWAYDRPIPIKSVGYSNHAVTNATYDPSTGVLVTTVAGHGFSNGEYVKVNQGALKFTCNKDSNATVKSYPTLEDPYYDEWVKVRNVTTDTFEINVGVAGPNGQHTHTFVSEGKLTPTSGAYNPTTGVMTITIPSHGFVAGDEIKVDDNAFRFTCLEDFNTSYHDYPRATDPISGQWVKIYNVTTDTFDIQVLNSVPSTNTTDHTFISAVANSITRSAIKKQTGVITFNTNNRDAAITHQYAHSFVSASATAVIAGGNYTHTFVQSTSDAVKTGGDYVHTFINAKPTSVKYGYTHLYTGNAIANPVTRGLVTSGGHEYDRLADAGRLIRANLDFIATTAYGRMLAVSPNFDGDLYKRKCIRDTKLISEAVANNIEFGGNDGVYDAANFYVNTVHLQGEEGQSVQVFNHARDICREVMRNITVTTNYVTEGSQVKDLTITNDSGDNTYTTADCSDIASAITTLWAIVTQAVGTGAHTFVQSTSGNITVTGGGSGPFTAVAPTTYDNTTGLMVMEIGSHSLTTSNTVTIAANSMTFTCENDANTSQKTYPRTSDPAYNTPVAITAVTGTTITVNVGTNLGNLNGITRTASESPEFQVEIDTVTFDGVDTTFNAQVNGSNYSLPASDNFLIFLNSILQLKGSTEAYTYTGSAITFNEAPVSGMDFYGFYFGKLVLLDDLSPFFDNSKETFTMTLQNEPFSLESDNENVEPSNNLMIFVNGVFQEPGVAYSLNGSIIKFSEAPRANSQASLYIYTGSDEDIFVSNTFNSIDPTDRMQVASEGSDRLIATVSSATSVDTYEYVGLRPTTATFTPVLTNGVVTNIIIDNPGENYEDPPVLLFQGGSGVGASGTTTIEQGSGKVLTATITNGGTGYLTVPTIVPVHAVDIERKSRDRIISNSLALGCTYLTSSITDSSTTLNCKNIYYDTSQRIGFPDEGEVLIPFYDTTVTPNRWNVERILYGSRNTSANTITVATGGRGYRGTTAAAHTVLTGTYSASGITCTVTTSATHNYVTGMKVFLDFTSGPTAEPINWGFDGEYAVTVTSGNTFTVEFPFSQTSSGNVSILPEVRLRSL